MWRFRCAFLAAAVLVATAAPAAAATGDSRIGGRVGLNWSRLTQPNDPIGSPTLMHGTAFDGMGYAIGPSFRMSLTTLGDLELGGGLDALYSRHIARGFEVNTEKRTRRTAVLRAHVLRLPVLAYLESGTVGREVTFFGGIGPELWAGLGTSATVELEGAPGPPDPLKTDPVTHLIFDVHAGVTFPMGPDLALPFEFRAAWDPFVGDTTVARFKGFRNSDAPGFYEVAFDWQILFLTGLTWTGL